MEENKLRILCNTKNEFNDVQVILNRMGYIWRSGHAFIKSSKRIYPSIIQNYDIGGFCGLNYYSLDNEFTNSDLNVGIPISNGLVFIRREKLKRINGS